MQLINETELNKALDKLTKNKDFSHPQLTPSQIQEIIKAFPAIDKITIDCIFLYSKQSGVSAEKVLDLYGLTNNDNSNLLTLITNNKDGASIERVLKHLLTMLEQGASAEKIFKLITVKNNFGYSFDYFVAGCLTNLDALKTCQQLYISLLSMLFEKGIPAQDILNIFAIKDEQGKTFCNKLMPIAREKYDELEGILMKSQNTKIGNKLNTKLSEKEPLILDVENAIDAAFQSFNIPIEKIESLLDKTNLSSADIIPLLSRKDEKNNNFIQRIALTYDLNPKSRVINVLYRLLLTGAPPWHICELIEIKDNFQLVFASFANSSSRFINREISQHVKTYLSLLGCLHKQGVPTKRILALLGGSHKENSFFKKFSKTAIDEYISLLENLVHSDPKSTESKKLLKLAQKQRDERVEKERERLPFRRHSRKFNREFPFCHLGIDCSKRGGAKLQIMLRSHLNSPYVYENLDKLNKSIAEEFQKSLVELRQAIDNELKHCKNDKLIEIITQLKEHSKTPRGKVLVHTIMNALANNPSNALAEKLRKTLSNNLSEIHCLSTHFYTFFNLNYLDAETCRKRLDDILKCLRQLDINGNPLPLNKELVEEIKKQLEEYIKDFKNDFPESRRQTLPRSNRTLTKDPNSVTTNFFMAISNLDYSLIARFLYEGISPNIYWHGCSMLMHAVDVCVKYKGDPKKLKTAINIVKLLLYYDADPRVGYYESPFDVIEQILRDINFNRISEKFAKQLIKILGSAKELDPSVVVHASKISENGDKLGNTVALLNKHLKRKVDPRINSVSMKDDKTKEFTFCAGVKVQIVTKPVTTLTKNELDRLKQITRANLNWGEEFTAEKITKYVNYLFEFRKDELFVDMVKNNGKIAALHLYKCVEPKAPLIIKEKPTKFYHIVLSVADKAFIRNPIYKRFMTIVIHHRGFALQKSCPNYNIITLFEAASMCLILQIKGMRFFPKYELDKTILESARKFLYSDETIVWSGQKQQHLYIKDKLAPGGNGALNPNNDAWETYNTRAVEQYNNCLAKKGYSLVVAYFNSPENSKSLSKIINPYLKKMEFDYIVTQAAKQENANPSRKLTNSL